MFLEVFDCLFIFSSHIVKWYDLLGHESEIRMIGFHMSIGLDEPALVQASRVAELVLVATRKLDQWQKHRCYMPPICTVLVHTVDWFILLIAGFLPSTVVLKCL